MKKGADSARIYARHVLIGGSSLKLLFYLKDLLNCGVGEGKISDNRTPIPDLVPLT